MQIFKFLSSFNNKSTLIFNACAYFFIVSKEGENFTLSKSEIYLSDKSTFSAKSSYLKFSFILKNFKLLLNTVLKLFKVIPSFLLKL